MASGAEVCSRLARGLRIRRVVEACWLISNRTSLIESLAVLGSIPNSESVAAVPEQQLGCVVLCTLSEKKNAEVELAQRKIESSAKGLAGL